MFFSVPCYMTVISRDTPVKYMDGKILILTAFITSINIYIYSQCVVQKPKYHLNQFGDICTTNNAIPAQIKIIAKMVLLAPILFRVEQVVRHGQMLIQCGINNKYIGTTLKQCWPKFPSLVIPPTGTPTHRCGTYHCPKL